MERGAEPSAPTLDEATVRRMAELARVALTEDEVTRMAGELERIVAYVASLPELPALESGGDRPWLAEGPRFVARADEPSPSLDRALVLGEAPSAHEGGFAVPTFVDEG